MKLLSLCMIVKNEEKYLARCLDSVQGLVDEIIIIDTGSTDSTKEIAQRYTDQIYDYKWKNDFSDARNASIRYATGKWILILDADEYVQNSGHQELRQYLNNYSSQKPSGCILKIINFTGNGYDETEVLESTGARIFSNNQGIHYCQPIHEQLTVKTGIINYIQLPFSIYHSGYIQEIVQEKNKSHRNMSILESMKITKKNDSYYLFVLGNEYSNAEQINEALRAYQSSYEHVKVTDTWYHHLMDRLITIEMQQHQYPLALKHIQNAISQAPEHTDYYCLLGILYDSLGYWNKAISTFEKCLHLADLADKRGVSYSIVQPTHGRIIPLQMLGDLYIKKGNTAKAIEYWIKTLQLQPKNYKILRRLIDYLLAVNTPINIIEILDMIYPKSVPINSVILFKMALLTGNRVMINHYKVIVDSLGINTRFEDQTLFNMSQRDQAMVPASTKEALTSHIAIMAAIIYQDISYCDYIEMDKKQYRLLTQQILLIIKEQPADLTVVNGFEETLSQVLFLLWRYDYKDSYFIILQQLANVKTLNILADMYYQTGATDEALELFSMLLENQILDTKGLETIGQWYINAGEASEALQFLKASLAESPSYNMIGIIYENYIPKQTIELTPLYLNHYPHMKEFPISTQ